MIFDIETVLVLGVFYLMFFWGLPIVGLPSNSVYLARYPETNPDELIPYWKAVRQVSFLIHLAVVIVGVVYYFARPYILVTI